jgi:ABC-2 type transport system ATP-binding protein
MLEVEHVAKNFGSVHAVSDVAFRIDDNVTFGLLGPNGAGKTTTMRMIVGVLAPDGGHILWNGSRVNGTSRRHFGYLPEERGIYGKLTVREQIGYFGKLHGVREPELKRRVDGWIERLGIGVYADRPCSELSKGNQQKVQVACAAVHDPKLLVLDEPFSGLDPVNAEMLLEILAEMRKQGTTLVLSSHQMWQMDALCSAVCIVTDGRNRVSGTLSDLRAAWPTRIVRVGPAPGAVTAVLDAVPGASLLHAHADGVEYRMPASTDFAALLTQLVALAPIRRFEALEPTLNEMYLNAVGAQA